VDAANRLRTCSSPKGNTRTSRLTDRRASCPAVLPLLSAPSLPSSPGGHDSQPKQKRTTHQASHLGGAILPQRWVSFPLPKSMKPIASRRKCGLISQGRNSSAPAEVGPGWCCPCHGGCPGLGRGLYLFRPALLQRQRAYRLLRRVLGPTRFRFSAAARLALTRHLPLRQLGRDCVLNAGISQRKIHHFRG
jgi:hypothetical protein